jgi:hypothetical protein
VRPPRRLPSAREYALLTWDARLEVLAALQSLKLAYLKPRKYTPVWEGETMQPKQTNDSTRS